MFMVPLTANVNSNQRAAISTQYLLEPGNIITEKTNNTNTSADIFIEYFLFTTLGIPFISPYKG